MGNSVSTNDIANIAAVAVLAVVARVLCSVWPSSGSVPNSHDSGGLHSVKSSSSSVRNSHDSGGLQSVQSSSSSVPSSHDSGGLHSVQSSSGIVPNSHDSGGLHSVKSSSSSVRNSHDSGGLQSVQSSSSSVPSSHDSGGLHSVKSSSSSVRNSHDSGGLQSLQSSSSSVPSSHDSGGLHSVQSSSGIVPNSHDSGLIHLPSGSGSASVDGFGSNEFRNYSMESQTTKVEELINSQVEVLLPFFRVFLKDFERSPGRPHQSVISASIGWQFPPKGWIKCNVDGSCWKAKRSAGCGGVYRNGKGKWVNGFARKLRYCSAMKAEILAINTGLTEAWRLGFRQLIIESDSKSAVDLVNKGCSASHSLAKPVKKARKYLRKEWQVNIVYLPRECNEAADWLSKFSHELQVGVHELKKPPKDCSKILLKDKSQAVCLPRSIVS